MGDKVLVTAHEFSFMRWARYYQFLYTQLLVILHNMIVCHEKSYGKMVINHMNWLKLNVLMTSRHLNSSQSLTSTLFCGNQSNHMSDISTSLTDLPWTKWPLYPRQYFEMHLHGWKVLYFDSNFTEVCSKGSNWQQVSTGSGNGLVLNRWQAITWTNAGPVHWHIYAALGTDELKIKGQLFLLHLSIKDTLSYSLHLSMANMSHEWITEHETNWKHKVIQGQGDLINFLRFPNTYSMSIL